MCGMTQILPSFPNHFRALVFGARGGIGAAFVAALETRCQVSALTRSDIDICDEAALEALAARVKAEGPVHLVVNATGLLHHADAGVQPEKALKQISAASMAKVLAVNVTANARLIRAMEPLLMQADAPRAVFTTSGAARKCRPFWGAYSTGKAALDALVKSWAHEHENDALRINLLSPGPIRTAMRAQAMPGEDPDTLPSPADLSPLFLELLSETETRTGEIVEYKR